MMLTPLVAAETDEDMAVVMRLLKEGDVNVRAAQVCWVKGSLSMGMCVWQKHFQTQSGQPMAHLCATTVDKFLLVPQLSGLEGKIGSSLRVW